MQHTSPFSRRLFPLLFAGFLLLQGCGRFVPHPSHEYVYVWARGTYLRDRVAAVSNRVAEVVNGQRLQVVEHGRRFLKVKTEKGEVGWIEDHGVIDQQTFDKFQQLEKDSAGDPVVGTAILRDDYWLRDAPGRTSDRFYLLPENDKLQLLKRASILKPAAPQAIPLPVPLEKPVSKSANRAKNDAPPAPPPPNLEDYWLIRDSSGRVGWVRARTLDEDVPDAIAGLAEGQKIVGAYVLRRVNDPGAGVPGDQVPEYVAVLSAWKDGLPYDFDQVRVFTWNVKKHRYETAYRQRNLVGFLPVSVTEAVPGNPQPTFSFRVATSDQAALDPKTGMVRPGDTVTETFRMDGVMVRREGTPLAHPTVTTRASAHSEKPHRKRRG